MRKAGWLPGVRDHDIREWRTLSFPCVDVVVPCLTPGGVRAQAERLKCVHADYLAGLSVSRIVALLDRVAMRWLEPASPYRREAEALLPSITGYAEPAIRKGLASWLATLREENVLRLLCSELSDPAALDGFVARPEGGGGETRAFGPSLTVHVWSGNVPGLPAQSLLSALLVKSSSLGKVASEEPLFATLLAESIADVDPRLAECVAVTYWPGGDDMLESEAFGQADAVIAYGTERAIDSIRARVPASARFVGYGHKLSFGVIGREALAPDLYSDVVDRAAYDVAKYDQQGCLSPHVFYVEEGGAYSPRDFAGALSARLAEYEAIVPRGRRSFEEAASQTALWQRYEARELAGQPVAIFPTEGGVVLFDTDPAFEASCLNRTIYVKPVSDAVMDLPPLVTPVRRYLQTCGVAADAERRRALAEALGRLGVDRVCPLGRMGDVAPTWHHDGRFNLLELLRWTDIEPDSSAGRWEFAHPDLGLYGEGVIANDR